MMSRVGAGAATGVAPASSGAGGISFAAIETSFDAWSRQRRIDGAGDDFMAGVDAARTSYLDVARKAEANGGFADPLSFVRGLGTDELRALQTTHSLADPIDTGSLTKEGALNLLLPGPMGRDLDGNGVTKVGEASTIIFPPGDAPQAVKDAWAASTDGMDFETRIHLEMSLDLAGNALRAGTDISSATRDYRALVDRAIEGTEFNRRHQPSDQWALTDRVLHGLLSLQAGLSSRQA